MHWITISCDWPSLAGRGGELEGSLWHVALCWLWAPCETSKNIRDICWNISKYLLTYSYFLQIYKGWNMVMASRTFKIYIQCLTIEWLNKKGGGDPCLSWACECRHHRPQSLLQWVPQGAASFDHLFSSFIFAKSQFWRKKITVLWSQYHNPTIPADCHEEKRTTERRQSPCCVQVCIKHKCYKIFYINDW